ncbi:MAG: hypothetical protein DCF32_09490 [Leptolyngbya sp.]|nr:MAG: hypothetical protein DCF32_09490 [Leptolyngbya sp.]
MTRKNRAEKQRADTERIALGIYHNRLLLGKPGDECSDWAKAEKIVRSLFRTTLFASNRPFILGRKPAKQAFKVIAWDAPRWFLFSLPQLEWIKLLAVPLVIAAAGSIITGQIQREANQNAVLKAYFDKLEELTFERNLLAETPDEGAIVLARGRTVAVLRELDFARRTQLIAFLQASDLSQIIEDSAEPVISFKAQNLSGLNLRRVHLSGLDFQEADLERTNLKKAHLERTNLEEADLENANLKKAHLVEANLEKADLKKVNLEEADLESANLKRADLSHANLERAFLLNANFEGAVDLTQDQLALAELCRTTLPEGITLDPNRDCEELGIDPKTGEYISP